MSLSSVRCRKAGQVSRLRLRVALRGEDWGISRKQEEYTRERMTCCMGDWTGLSGWWRSNLGVSNGVR